MSQAWPLRPLLIQRGTVATPSAARAVITFPQPFAGVPQVTVTPLRTGASVVVPDVPVALVTATGFEVSTHVSTSGAITAGSVSWVAVGVPA